MNPDFQSRRSRRRPGLRDVALWGVVALALGASIQQAATQGSRLRKNRASLQALREQIDADETRLREMKQGAREMSSMLAMRIALTQDAPPEHVLAVIENILPAGARLDGITLQYGDALAVTFMVVARRPEIYDVFLERMESSSSFTDLSFGAESRDGEIRVSIDAAYLGGGRS